MTLFQAPFLIARVPSTAMTSFQAPFLIVWVQSAQTLKECAFWDLHALELFDAMLHFLAKLCLSMLKDFGWYTPLL